MTACSLFNDDGTGYTFKVSLSDFPQTLDPQLAYDEASMAVARNMFVGLLKYDQNGKLTKGMASDYSISSDGKVYTFTLNENYEWRAVDDLTTEKKADIYKAPVTAYDFVFAFERLFTRSNASPYANDYFAILNAEDVYNGGISIDNLGVKAIGSYTLEITLEYQNADFLHLLTLLPASPCNEEYFNSTKGKYGLEANCIASNGPFYARDWTHDKYSKDNYIRLRRNDAYSSVSSVSPYGVTYLINTDESVKINNFTSKTTDVLLSNRLLNSDFDEYTTEKYYTFSCGIVFNPNNEILSRYDVKETLSMALNVGELKNIPDYLLPSNGIIPHQAYLGGSGYRQSVPEPTIEYNPSMAEFKWNFILSETEKSFIQGCNIMVEDTFSDYKYLEEVTKVWRDLLGVSFGIDVVNSTDYKQRLESGNYDMCLAVLTSDTGTAFDYILPFADRIENINEIIQKRGKYNTLTEQFYDLSSAEAELITKYEIIPLWYIPEYCFVSDDVEGVGYDIYTKSLVFENALSF